MLFFTVFFAFGAEAFAARFAFAMMTTRVGLCKEIPNHHLENRPRDYRRALWTDDGKEAALKRVFHFDAE